MGGNVSYPDPDALDAFAKQWDQTGDDLDALYLAVMGAWLKVTWTGKASGYFGDIAFYVRQQVGDVASQTHKVAQNIRDYAQQIRDLLAKLAKEAIISIIADILGLAALFLPLGAIISALTKAIVALLQGILKVIPSIARAVAPFISNIIVGSVTGLGTVVISEGIAAAATHQPFTVDPKSWGLAVGLGGLFGGLMPGGKVAPGKGGPKFNPAGTDGDIIHPGPVPADKPGPGAGSGKTPTPVPVSDGGGLSTSKTALPPPAKPGGIDETKLLTYRPDDVSVNTPPPAHAAPRPSNPPVAPHDPAVTGNGKETVRQPPPGVTPANGKPAGGGSDLPPPAKEPVSQGPVARNVQVAPAKLGQQPPVDNASNVPSRSALPAASVKTNPADAGRGASQPIGEHETLTNPSPLPQAGSHGGTNVPVRPQPLKPQPTKLDPGSDASPNLADGGAPVPSRPSTPPPGPTGHGDLLPPKGTGPVPPKGNLVPDKGNLVPPKENLVPPRGSSAPSRENLVPDKGNLVPPPKEGLVPPRGSSAPPRENLVPDKGSSVPPPKANDVVPESGSSVPAEDAPPPVTTPHASLDVVPSGGPRTGNPPHGTPPLPRGPRDGTDQATPPGGDRQGPPEASAATPPVHQGSPDADRQSMPALERLKGLVGLGKRPPEEPRPPADVNKGLADTQLGRDDYVNSNKAKEPLWNAALDKLKVKYRTIADTMQGLSKSHGEPGDRFNQAYQSWRQETGKELSDGTLTQLRADFNTRLGKIWQARYADPDAGKSIRTRPGGRMEPITPGTAMDRGFRLPWDKSGDPAANYGIYKKWPGEVDSQATMLPFTFRYHSGMDEAQARATSAFDAARADFTREHPDSGLTEDDLGAMKNQYLDEVKSGYQASFRTGTGPKAFDKWQGGLERGLPGRFDKELALDDFMKGPYAGRLNQWRHDNGFGEDGEARSWQEKTGAEVRQEIRTGLTRSPGPGQRPASASGGWREEAAAKLPDRFDGNEQEAQARLGNDKEFDEIVADFNKNRPDLAKYVKPDALDKVREMYHASAEKAGPNTDGRALTGARTGDYLALLGQREQQLFNAATRNVEHDLPATLSRDAVDRVRGQLWRDLQRSYQETWATKPGEFGRGPAGEGADGELWNTWQLRTHVTDRTLDIRVLHEQNLNAALGRAARDFDELVGPIAKPNYQMSDEARDILAAQFRADYATGFQGLFGRPGESLDGWLSHEMEFTNQFRLTTGGLRFGQAWRDGARIPGQGDTPASHPLTDGWVLEFHDWGMWFRPPSVGQDVLTQVRRGDFADPLSPDPSFVIGMPHADVPPSVVAAAKSFIDTLPTREGGHSVSWLGNLHPDGFGTRPRPPARGGQITSLEPGDEPPPEHGDTPPANLSSTPAATPHPTTPSTPRSPAPAPRVPRPAPVPVGRPRPAGQRPRPAPRTGSSYFTELPSDLSATANHNAVILHRGATPDLPADERPVGAPDRLTIGVDPSAAGHGGLGPALANLHPTFRPRLTVQLAGHWDALTPVNAQATANQLLAGADPTASLLVPADRLTVRPAPSPWVVPVDADGEVTFTAAAAAFRFFPDVRPAPATGTPYGLAAGPVPGTYRLPGGWYVDGRDTGAVWAGQHLPPTVSPTRPGLTDDVPLAVGAPGGLVPDDVMDHLTDLATAAGLEVVPVGRPMTDAERMWHATVSDALPDGWQAAPVPAGSVIGPAGRPLADPGPAGLRPPGPDTRVLFVDPAGTDAEAAARAVADTVAALPAYQRGQLMVQPVPGVVLRWQDAFTLAGRGGRVPVVVPRAQLTAPPPVDEAGFVPMAWTPAGPVRAVPQAADHYQLHSPEATPDESLPAGLTAGDGPGRYGTDRPELDGWVVDTTDPAVVRVHPSDTEPVGSGVPARPGAVRVEITGPADQSQLAELFGLVGQLGLGRPLDVTLNGQGDGLRTLENAAIQRALPPGYVAHQVPAGHVVAPEGLDPAGLDGAQHLPPEPEATLIEVAGDVPTGRILGSLPASIRDQAVLHHAGEPPLPDHWTPSYLRDRRWPSTDPAPAPSRAPDAPRRATLTAATARTQVERTLHGPAATPRPDTAPAVARAVRLANLGHPAAATDHLATAHVEAAETELGSLLHEVGVTMPAPPVRLGGGAEASLQHHANTAVMEAVRLLLAGDPARARIVVLTNRTALVGEDRTNWVRWLGELSMARPDQAGDLHDLSHLVMTC